jgi:hypothetical protein
LTGEAESRDLTRRRLTKHEKDLNAHELKLKGLELAEKVTKTTLLTRQGELLEQEVSRLWWDKYTRLASCVAIFGIVIGWLGPSANCSSYPPPTGRPTQC